jgi:uncharacterized membrane protein
VAALSYLLLPLTGVIAFLVGMRPRVRFHGLQAITLGTLWILLLYGAARASPTVTQIAFVIGAAAWIGFLVATAMGRDPELPVVAPYLRVIADFAGGPTDEE